MRHLKTVLLLLLGSFLLLLLAYAASRFTPANRQAEAERLIRSRLPPGSDEKQVGKFLVSQDADAGTHSNVSGRDIFGHLPLIPPSSWEGYKRLGVPYERLEDYDHGLRFYFVIDGRGKMVSFKVYPPGQ